MIRKIALFFIKLFNRDIYIKHHFTKVPFFLNLYRHKGYWYKGAKREKLTMETFEKIIKKGDTVVEVGGHIGYISNYFSFLVGSSGKVLVYEPGSNNLQYIRKNCLNLSNIELIEKGVGSKDEELTFYIENLTGQNNSFVKDFEGYKYNRSASIENDLECKEEKVQIVKLDGLLEKIHKIDFIKVDVEGFEYEVVKGCLLIIEKKDTNFMIEIQDNFEEIYNIFKQNEYKIIYENGQIISNLEAFKAKTYGMNRFFLAKN